MNKIMRALLVVAPAAASAPASAEVESYTAGWQIERLPEERGCAMTAQLNDGTLLSVFRAHPALNYR